MIERLALVKKAELLVGIHISPEEFSNLTNEQFLAKIETTMYSLLPLYAICNHKAKRTIFILSVFSCYHIITL